ncbi:hypothetical protein DFJ74DRAFT_710845 [Hyaloraphidium curvatum]|nr:hypothetical protein DFJ74DRAFT_710845 [Hyaloraphidium curvatum]
MCPTAPAAALLLSLLSRTPALPALRALSRLSPPLPPHYLAGGCVRNPVWAALFRPCALRINDFDVAFYDPEGGREQESAAKAELESLFPGSVFDVKNQFSFGRWRPRKDHRPGVPPYSSAEDGISDWLHTATAVGLRLETAASPPAIPGTVLVEHGGETVRVLAPYGLEDLLRGVVRAVPPHARSTAARDKARTFLAACPGLLLARPDG